MQFNAWTLARSWASVALAQGADEKRPALYRSMLIEMYPEGIRLVSTDSYLLLKAWVPIDGFDSDSEPGEDVLPDDTAICSDPDHRVLGLMKYAQQMTKQDGEDTAVTITLGFGEMLEGKAQGSFDGMTQASVWFHLGHQYDERIETPRYDGQFPEWRPLWFNHRWEPTPVIGFGADGILRLGKLSALWDKTTIEFDLGGPHGVAKIRIAPKPNTTGRVSDVNVTGLVMPTKLTHTAPSESARAAAEDESYSDVIDDFLASVLGAEADHANDALLDQAEKAQMAKVYFLGLSLGHLTAQIIVDDLDVSAERAETLINELLQAGAIEPAGDDKFDVIEDIGLFDDDEPEDGEEPL